MSATIEEAPAPAPQPLLQNAAADIVYVYGASDDLVEVEGNCPGCDEYSGDDVYLRLIGKGNSTILRVSYESRGVWAIEVAPVAENLPMHEVRIVPSERSYSPLAAVVGVEQVVLERGSDA